MGEEWKAIPGWEGLYEASTDGRVRSLDRIVVDTIDGRIRTRNFRGRVLVLTPIPKRNHVKVNLNREGVVSTYQVHSLILLTFVGPCPPGLECRHLDGNARNNCVSNLKWGTSVENKADMLAHGRRPAGERHGSARLTERDISRIRELLSAGVYQTVIAEEYGVNQSTISAIARRKNWAHVPS